MNSPDASKFELYDTLAKALAERLRAKETHPHAVIRYTKSELCLHADATMEEAQQISLLPTAAHLRNVSHGVYKHFTLFRAAIALII